MGAIPKLLKGRITSESSFSLALPRKEGEEACTCSLTAVAEGKRAEHEPREGCMGGTSQTGSLAPDGPPPVPAAPGGDGGRVVSNEGFGGATPRTTPRTAVAQRRGWGRKPPDRNICQNAAVQPTDVVRQVWDRNARL